MLYLQEARVCTKATHPSYSLSLTTVTCLHRDGQTQVVVQSSAGCSTVHRQRLSLTPTRWSAERVFIEAPREGASLTAGV
jgi:hypothetical protein